MLTHILHQSPKLCTFFDQLNIDMYKPQCRHIINLADALLVCGLVPRTFEPAHPLADCLRLTVRSAQENDRLIAAAREIPA